MSRRSWGWITVIAAVAAFTGSASLRAQEALTVGSETCAACHEETAASFRSTVHGKDAPETACETCHGPGSLHVDEGDPSRIRRFAPSDPATARSRPCLACHERSRIVREWAGSDHAAGGLACDSCHDPHEPVTRGALLRASTPELCLGCHGDVRAQFALPESHPVARGGMDCIDCHDPHRRTERRHLGGFKQDECLRCHSEYRGPWFFEHEVVAVEGCGACHAPHGSVNRHLLTYQRVGDLCLQCHPGQPFFHVVVDASGERTTGINDCTRCHSEIHGSNNDALFLN